MTLLSCDTCHNGVSSDAMKCPTCGRNRPTMASRKRARAIRGVYFLLALFGGGVFLYTSLFTPEAIMPIGSWQQSAFFAFGAVGILAGFCGVAGWAWDYVRNPNANEESV
ncbi:MAG: hypothetical protein WDN06_05810 [Asticcacaulis sp.]